MAPRGLALAFLMVLVLGLLAWGQKGPSPKNQGEAKEAGGCKAPSNWDLRLQFTPNRSSYALNDLVELSCPGDYVPSVTQIRCISSGTRTLWNTNATCKETCQRLAWWDPRLRMAPARDSYKKNEEVTLSCSSGFQPSFTHIKCAGKAQTSNYSGSPNRNVWLGKDSSGAWIHVQGNIVCIEVLQVVPGSLQISSTSIKLNWICRLPDACHNVWAKCRLEDSSSACEAEEVKETEMLQGQEGTFTCSSLQPFTVYSINILLPPSTILYTRLLRTKETVPDKPEQLWLDPSTGSLKWKALSSCNGDIIGYQLNITAWRVRDGSFLEFKQVLLNHTVTQYMPPLQTPGSKYMVTVQGLTAAGAGAGSLLEFQSYVSEGCQKPLWDPKFIFDQERDTFNIEEVVKVKCPEGHRPPPMEIKCAKQTPEKGYTISRSRWLVGNGTGHWHLMERNLTCVEVLQVVPGSLQISSTSIKLNWICRLPDACHNIWAKCRLEDSSSACEAEEVKETEMLQGQEGTFTCSSLQPFTVYSINILLPPSTILYTRLFRTKETVPDKPEQLWLDPSTGSLKWKALSSCNGDIIGYQLNITAWRVRDGSFLEFKQVLLNHTVTQYMPPLQTPGSKYMVTVQGLTAAGAGAGSLLEFQSYVSEGCQKPLWDPKFIFDQERDTFNIEEVVKVKCPEGHRPPPMEIKCAKQTPEKGYTISRSRWFVRNGTGHWHLMERNLTCVAVLEVVPGSLQISSTSIKLNWICRLPDACHNVWAKCRLEDLSSACEVQEVKETEMLQGQEGTFTCSSLQPFTVYSVNILLPPSTILYTRLLRTKETVPDKPEQLWLDPSTGSLKWKALSSCNGDIIGYQLNIMARNTWDGRYLEVERLRLSGSVTEHPLPEHWPRSSFVVMLQGVTAAGAGAASRWEFASSSSVAGQFPGSWPRLAVIVLVVVVVVLVLQSAGILWFVVSRRRKALPSKAEEDHYTELQPYENLDNYCVIKEALRTEEDAGKGGQDGDPLPKTLPFLESSEDSQHGDEQQGRLEDEKCAKGLAGTQDSDWHQTR
ncbi:uncharacterized protein LOC104557545 [Colius striatus]|uniref:uncharacterized protein LOC104557545 n=1 Tax=Colius striatus TaxID=57412 RepID=UPI002B1DA492|nr:uncharacterized protein LOC104557545 [Colius striatus]